MRIAYITQYYPPMISGAAIVVERLAQGMAERGHQTLVLAASDKGQAYIEESDNLRIVRLASLHNPKRANQYYTLPSFHKIAKELKSGFYIAHPYHAWERGLNENTNGLIRQYFPKKSSFENITDDQVQIVMNRLNNRPRKTLGFATPIEIFFNLSHKKAA